MHEATFDAGEPDRGISRMWGMRNSDTVAAWHLRCQVLHVAPEMAPARPAAFHAVDVLLSMPSLKRRRRCFSGSSSP
jgi:hypothetical protein